MCIYFSFSLAKAIIWIENSYFRQKQWFNHVKTPWCTAFVLTNTHLFILRDINWRFLWIIVMFLSTVWTLILTAPIHCRGSNATFLQICSHEEPNSSISWMVGVHCFNIWENYSVNVHSGVVGDNRLDYLQGVCFLLHVSMTLTLVLNLHLSWFSRWHHNSGHVIHVTGCLLYSLELLVASICLYLLNEGLMCQNHQLWFD